VQILAFECIPVLRDRFREPVPNCPDGCPRMCKWKFKRTGTTGFPLDMIYRTLGNTKVKAYNFLSVFISFSSKFKVN